MRKIILIIIGGLLINTLLSYSLFALQGEEKVTENITYKAEEVMGKHEVARQSFMFFCGYPLDKIKKESPKDPLVNGKSIPIATK